MVATAPRTGPALSREEQRAIARQQAEFKKRCADREWLQKNPAWFRENCIQIVTKEEGLQPFRPNFTQRVLFAKRAELVAAGLPPRIIVLKSRQVGISTATEIDFFTDCYLNPYRRALVIAHEKDAAKGLLMMTRGFNRELPESMRLPMRHDSTTALEFPHGSRMQIEAEGEIRSMTANAGVHFSEMAFYKEPKRTLKAGLQALPRSLDTMCVIESTANGQGNLFHRMWLRAVNAVQDRNVPVQEQGFFPLFIPWWKHEEYMMQPWFLPQETTQVERKLAHKYKLKMRQLAWRRWCIATNFAGDEEEFATEYPATWREAFEMTGRPIWEAKDLEPYTDLIPPQMANGSVWERTPAVEIEWDNEKKRPLIVPTHNGRLRIFAEPNPRHTYILFADPSEGDRKSDPTPIQVIDQMNFEQAAEWWGRCPPDVLARYAAWLGTYFNHGEINAEANNHGILFFASLLELEYPKIWWRTTNEESVAGEVTLKPGLMQTNRTKHAMFGTGRRFVRERRGKIHSPILLGEMMTAEYDRKDGADATKITKPEGCYIDAALAWCGALFTHRGSDEAPLLPLPEIELVSASQRAALIGERDPESGNRLAVDLTGMTASQLEEVLIRRNERKRRARQGYGGGTR